MDKPSFSKGFLEVVKKQMSVSATTWHKIMKPGCIQCFDLARLEHICNG